MSTKSTLRIAELQLILVAIVWGGGFIATEYAINAKMPTSMIMSLRFLLAAFVMTLISLKELKNLDKKTLLSGSVAGLLLFFAFYTQTLGQTSTNVSNAAFLTATNVVIVPFIVWIISKHKPKNKIFLLALTTLIGIAVLTIKPGNSFSFNIGDALTLLCAILFAFHIAYLGIFSVGLNAKLLTLLQLGVCGIISAIVYFITDFKNTPATAFADGIIPILYLALFSTCFCYFFQTKAQQIVPPGKAGIILCTESLFGTLFSVVLGLEPLTASIVIGGLIIISSVMLSEVDIRNKNRN